MQHKKPTQYRARKQSDRRPRLSDSNVLMMRFLNKEYGRTPAELAKEFDCGQSTARDICNNKTRKNAGTPYTKETMASCYGAPVRNVK